MRKHLTRLLVGTVLFGAGLLFGSHDRFQSAMAADAQTANRVFEIRTYTTHEGKLDDLHSRFRDHTTRLFLKHGITSVGYWVPQDPERSENTLVYLLAYPSREAATAAWAAFRADPEWQTARAASEEAGPIVQLVESVFLDPTDYSPMK
jgi:hypothetical protein